MCVRLCMHVNVCMCVRDEEDVAYVGECNISTFIPKDS